MFKQMKYFLFFVLCTGPLLASSGSGKWMVDAEFLYLLPSINDSYFVMKSPISLQPSPRGKRINNGLGFNPAFRVGIGYQWCPCAQGIELYYSGLNASTGKTVNGILWATIGHPDFISPNFRNYDGLAKSFYNLKYQRVDGWFITQLWCGRKMSLFLYPGIEYANLQVRERYFYAGTTTIFHTGAIRLKFGGWGIGPQLGLKFGFNLYECSCRPAIFSIVASASGSLLASKTQQAHLEISDDVLLLKVTDQSTWRLIPALHARMGLKYATCLSCLGVALELGYEFHKYSRLLTRNVFFDDVGDGANIAIYNNFSAQGLYLSLALTY